MDDDKDDYDVDASIRSFRVAGSRVIEGFEHLYHGSKELIGDQHVVVQAATTVGLWFAGNWVYNRIAPPLVDSVERAISAFRVESIVVPFFAFLGGDFAVSTAQLLGISTGALLGQNRFQTRRLKRIETNVIAMRESDATATDGGSPETEPVGGGGLGGAIAGGSIGLSFGPGGVLAGAYLGYVLGERLTRGTVPDTPTERP